MKVSNELSRLSYLAFRMSMCIFACAFIRGTAFPSTTDGEIYLNSNNYEIPCSTLHDKLHSFSMSPQGCQLNTQDPDKQETKPVKLESVKIWFQTTGDDKDSSTEAQVYLS